MLCAPEFIFTSGSSALIGRPRCGLSIWLSLLAIFNTLFWVYVNFFTRKRTKHKNTRRPPFSYDTKWPPMFTRRAKHYSWVSRPLLPWDVKVVSSSVSPWQSLSLPEQIERPLTLRLVGVIKHERLIDCHYDMMTMVYSPLNEYTAIKTTT